MTVSIEFCIDGEWSQAGTELTPNVAAVRISRFGHPVTIEFDAPQPVDLADEVVRTSYQSRDLIQDLRIDLLRGSGKPEIMPKRARVCYTIRAGG